MNRRIYWGIATLIILLGIFGAFLFIKDRAEIRPLGKELTESNKRLKEHNKEKTEQPTSELTKQPSPNASPNGHWHGDESHTPVEVSTDVQKDRVVAQPANTKIDAPNLESTARRLKDPEVYKAWLEWSKKHKELSDQFKQASNEVLDAMPATEEELEQFKTAPEKQRKYNEALAKMAKIGSSLRVLESENPLLQ